MSRLTKKALINEIFYERAFRALGGTGTSVGECVEEARRLISQPENITLINQLGEVAYAANNETNLERAKQIFEATLTQEQELKDFIETVPNILKFPIQLALEGRADFRGFMRQLEVLR